MSYKEGRYRFWTYSNKIQDGGYQLFERCGRNISRTDNDSRMKFNIDELCHEEGPY